MSAAKAGDGREWPWWPVLVAVLMLVSTAGPLGFGLPIPGFLSGSDGNFALDLTTGSMDALRGGVWFPHWLPGSNAGLGSPVFYFYGRFPFLVAAMLGVGLHLRPVSALLTGIFCFRVFGFYTCRAWLRAGACRRAADCGALAFVAFPFAMTLNPVTRIGFAEIAATALIPLVFFALDAVLASRRRGAAGLAALAMVYALLACTHLPQLLLALAVSSLYLAARRSVRGFVLNVFGFGLGLLLAGASVLPAVRLQGEISAAAWSNSPYLAVGNNLLFTAARFRLYGLYGLDLALYATWLLCAGILVAALLQRSAAKGEAVWIRGRALQIALGAVLLAMTGLAEPLWGAIHPLRVLQFPWRLFPGALVLAAALVALLAEGNRRRQRVLLAVTGCVVLGQFGVVAAGAALSFHPRLRTLLAVREDVSRSLPMYVPHTIRGIPEFARKRSVVPEYLPAVARVAGWHISQPDEERLLPGSWAASGLPAELKGTAGSGGTLQLGGVLPAPGLFDLPIFFFPDEVVTGRPDIPLRLDERTGLAQVRLPAGPVAISIAHTTELPAVRWGQRASALGVLLVLTLLLFCFRAEVLTLTGRFRVGSHSGESGGRGTADQVAAGLPSPMLSSLDQR